MTEGVGMVVAEVAAAVERVLGAAVRSAERVAGSVANEDFLVTLVERPAVVVKVGPWAELVRERWACDRLRALGLPVPEVLVTEAAGILSRPFLVMSVVGGGPSDRAEVLRAAGRVLRRVHDVELPGFGPVVVHGREVDGREVDGGDARGAESSWAHALAGSVAGAEDVVRAGILDARTVERAVVLATGDLTAYDGVGRLLHRDLKPAHLFGVGERLTGVIDWGDASVGDPLLDLARLSMAPAAVYEAVLDGYGGGPVDGRRLAAYRIGWDLGALVYEHRAGGDWFDVYAGRLRADVALLDRR